MLESSSFFVVVFAAFILHPLFFILLNLLDNTFLFLSKKIIKPWSHKLVWHKKEKKKRGGVKQQLLSWPYLVWPLTWMSNNNSFLCLQTELIRNISATGKTMTAHKLFLPPHLKEKSNYSLNTITIIVQ